jgi:uncharacterized phiE125 gp8 family phage protein
VSITYVAGEASAPEAIQQAIRLAVAHWYANREAAVVGASVQALPLAFDALIAPFRRVRV